MVDRTRLLLNQVFRKLSSTYTPCIAIQKLLVSAEVLEDRIRKLRNSGRYWRKVDHWGQMDVLNCTGFTKWSMETSWP